MTVIARIWRFWFDFVVGDDAVLAIGVVCSIGIALGLHALDVNGWWGLCAGVIATLIASLYRATTTR
jgi:hypothetical protein